MSSASKDHTVGAEKRTQTQQGLGTLWSNPDEMRRYVLKLKSELDEQKDKVKRVHRDKAEEIKRLQDNLDHERQKAIENVEKKLQSDKAYELRKVRETVSKQKESELREVLRLKDEEMRTMRHELNEFKNTSKILEVENKRILHERLRGDSNELDYKRLKGEVTSLKQDKRRLEENLRVKAQADFEKAEMIRKMTYEHDLEVQRLTRESKKEALKEFRHLKAASKQLEEKNQQLATREAEMRRLEMEKNSLGNELNLQRKKTTPGRNLRKSNSFDMKKPDPEFENAAEDKIKKLKMRNSELVAIARKLEVKAKQLQEEKDILEKSSGSSPEIGQIKKAFARQRAKDLAEHAKLLMTKDNEINNLKKEFQGSCNGLNESDNVDELTKIVEQTAKERLLVEKQFCLKEQSLIDEIKGLNEKKSKILNDNEMLKEELLKLHDVEAKHFEAMFALDEIKEEHKVLQEKCLEKDNRISELELDKEAFLVKNDALQRKNNELSTEVNRLEELENECLTLNKNLQNLKSAYDAAMSENSKLRTQIESLTALRKEVGRLQKENKDLHEENQDSLLKLEERQNEIASLHQVQIEAQKKHNTEVSDLGDMINRLKTQSTGIPDNDEELRTSSLKYLNSTPKDTKCTQTSRASSPTLFSLSPIKDESVVEVNDVGETENYIRESLHLPDNATSSSTSFELEKAATRIDQLAASDSDDTSSENSRRRTDSPSYSSELSSDDRQDEGSNASGDTSYSADISQTSDLDQPLERIEGSKHTVAHDVELDDTGTFIGSPSPENLDIDEKLSIFIAKYSYDPMLYSPNENPEIELAFQAGDYLYVYGDVDEDGFYVGELMSGERGLVPSNFIERIAEEDEAILKGSPRTGDDIDDDSEDDSSEEEITFKDENGKRKVIRPKPFSERRHEMFRTSLDHVLNDQLDDIRESEEEELALNFDKDVAKRRNERTEVDQNFSDSLNSTESDAQLQRVCSPSKLSLDRQFTTSALVSWQGADQADEEIDGYNVYVDGKLKTHIKGNNKTNALVEDIYPNKTYRLSVRTKSYNGAESLEDEATMVIGPDAKFSPYDLQVTYITEISAVASWRPANSCHSHEVFLDDTFLICLKPNISTHTISDLSPSTAYKVRVRAQIPNETNLILGRAMTEDELSCEVEFTTCAGGLPDPPVNLRLDKQTSDDIILTWLPVTISQSGYSNGFKVTNYKVYVNDIYCTETDSPSVDSVTIGNERLRELGKRQDLTRMYFVVRTQSVMGESVDSNVVEIMSEGSDCMREGYPPELKNMKVSEIKPVVETALAGSNVDSKDLEGNSRFAADNMSKNQEPSTLSSAANESLSEINDVEQEELGTSSESQEHLSATEEQQRKPGTTSEIRGRYPSQELSDEISSPFEDGTESSLESTKENGKESDKEASSSNDVGLVTQDLPDVKKSGEESREPVVIHYNLQDEETESESCTGESMTETEEEVIEVFPNKITNVENESNTIDERDKSTSDDDIVEDNEHLANTVIIKPISDSETESEQLLSVIDEVDEDNLTTTTISLTDKTAQEYKNENFVHDVAKATFTDTSQSSVYSESKTKTISSEDDGFKTEDDVLDLLEDDESDFVANAARNLRSSDILKTNLTSDDIEKDDVVEKKNESNDLQPNKGAVLVTNDEIKKDSIVPGIQETEPLSEREVIENNVDKGQYENESSVPTRTSFQSDSLSSSSDLPPHADDKTAETIIKTLSYQDSREPGSGASDNAQTDTGSERTSEVFSESGRSGSETGEITSETVRYFVALYEYDPLIMSPNDDGADEELPFNEGDLIKVFGDKDDDGFFWGECRKKQGYVPSNMVTEVTIDDAEDIFNETSFAADQTTKTNGLCEIDVDMVNTDFISNVSYEETKNRLSFWDTVENGDLGPRKMRALFDYNPVYDSPNVDREVELMFRKGEVIYVFGDMDDDGFFQGELHGIRGLVPSNFLEEFDDNDSQDEILPETSTTSPKPSTSKEEEHQLDLLSSKQPNGTTKREEEQHKKKKGLFSKGKKMFKKAFR